MRVKGVSPYVKYVKLGLEKSKEFAKLGYSYSLRGTRYSYKKGKDGLYYVTIQKNMWFQFYLMQREL